MSIASPIRTKPSLPHSLQSLQSDQEVQLASYPSPSEDRQNENHSHRKLIKLITWTTALFNSMKLWAMPPKMDGGEFWQNMVHQRRKWQTTSVFLPWEAHEHMKRQNHRILKEELPRSLGAQYTNMLLEISGEITPERMKGWNQSKDNTKQWDWW